MKLGTAFALVALVVWLSACAVQLPPGAKGRGTSSVTGLPTGGIVLPPAQALTEPLPGIGPGGHPLQPMIQRKTGAYWMPGF